MLRNLAPLWLALALPMTAAAASSPSGGSSTASSTSSTASSSAASSSASRPRDTTVAREAARTGVAQHERFKQDLNSRPGSLTNVRMSSLETKQGAIPDGITKNQRPIEVKPDTVSGQAKMASQLRRYEDAMGKRGIGVYYDQAGNRRLERTPYNEWKARGESSVRAADRPAMRFVP